MRRTFAATALALAMTLVLSSAALAHFCTNLNKKDGAGSVAKVTLVWDADEEDYLVGQYDITSPSGRDASPGQEKKNDFARANGGFITIAFVGGPADGESFDVFVHTTLPDGAMNAGPGDDLCDGKGIDDALACLGFVEH